MLKITSEELQEWLKNNRTEDVYFDYKQEWHSNNAELILDILCLSNAEYNGDRFLIIGINDSANLVGVDKDRKDSAKLFDLLRQSNFNKLPTIACYYLQINDKIIDIIQIANSHHKPYFLTKDKCGTKSDTKIRAGVVYSRNGSANTPINSTASESEIEKMWRSRFGIDITPIERAKNYLLDVDNWHTGIDCLSYYETFPEFTIKDKPQIHGKLASDLEWLRGEIGHICSTYEGDIPYHIGIDYHQTCLKRINVVGFDAGRKTIVAPFFEIICGGRFYYYLEDSVEFAYQQHLVAKGDQGDCSINLCLVAPRKGYFAIPRLKNQQELEQFLQYAKNITLSYDGHIQRDENAQNESFYLLLDTYAEWKESLQLVACVSE